MSWNREELFTVFERFATFGVTKAQQSGSLDNLDGPKLDNSKFAKLCKDTKIVDGKNITLTDIDITFNKHKQKTARKISFDEFISILKELASLKFPMKDANAAFMAIYQLIISNKTPTATATKTETNDGIYAKLTNTALYTGSSKEKVYGKSQEDITGTLKMENLVDRSKRPNNSMSGSMHHLHKKADNKESSDKLTKSINNLNKSIEEKKSSKDDIFSRLTDTSKYTGTHKHRFDKNGMGLGLEGRDHIAKGAGTFSKYRGGQVNSISQILRQ